MIEVWTDGSYKEENGLPTASWAFVVVEDGEVAYEEFGDDVPPHYLESRNVAGEIYAVQRFLEFCVENDENEAVIHYDYEGLEKWASGEWKTNKELTKQYKMFVNNCGVRIKWVKVKGHSGDVWNEYADSLVRSAISNYDTQKEYNIPKEYGNTQAEPQKDLKAENPSADIFQQAKECFEKQKYFETVALLKPFVNKDCEENLFKLYADSLVFLGDRSAEKCVKLCEKYIELHPKSKVLRTYCYALFYAYVRPVAADSGFDKDRYISARSAIMTILGISKNSKIINEFVYPFLEYAFRIGDRGFVNGLLKQIDINLFSKEKFKADRMDLFSRYERVIYILNNSKT